MIDDKKAIAAVRSQPLEWHRGFYKPPIPGWTMSGALSWRTSKPQPGEEIGPTKAQAEAVLYARSEPVTAVGEAFNGEYDIVIFETADGYAFGVQAVFVPLFRGLEIRACLENPTITLIGVEAGFNVILAAQVRI